MYDASWERGRSEERKEGGMYIPLFPGPHATRIRRPLAGGWTLYTGLGWG